MRIPVLSFCLMFLVTAVSWASDPGPQIAWYGTMEGGLAAAEATGKPIMFLSAAPHCAGVPGMW